MDIIIELPELPGQPTYVRLAEGLRRAILEGRFRPGERLPATRVVARSLGIARNTVLEAYDHLSAEGYLAARHGSGTYVAPELPDRAFRPRRAPSPTAAGGSGGPSELSEFARRLGGIDTGPTVGPGRLPYDFRYGTPSFAEFPMAEWRALTRRVLDYPPPELLGYGPAEGLPALREALARYLQRSRGVRCTAADVIVVNGSQQALDLAARVLLDAGDVVAMEDPGYNGARAVFRAAGAQVAPARVDGDGIVVEGLPPEARVVYVTPSHQFPTGAVMSATRRMELLAWAWRTGAAVIEDDYDSEFRYAGRPLAALQGLDDTGRVIYTGTMSKVLLPALRLGYVVPPAHLRPAFAQAKWLTDRHVALFYQAVLAMFIDEGQFERHLRRMRRVYARRLERLLDGVEQHLGSRATVQGTESGIHVMLTIHDVEDGAAIVEGARALGVGLHPAAGYYAGEPPPGASFVVGYSSLDEAAIEEGIARVARVIRAYDQVSGG
jgi:GntR family transcriptional regulator/MocR family aminotransferase